MILFFLGLLFNIRKFLPIIFLIIYIIKTQTPHFFGEEIFICHLLLYYYITLFFACQYTTLTNSSTPLTFLRKILIFFVNLLPKRNLFSCLMIHSLYYISIPLSIRFCGFFLFFENFSQTLLINIHSRKKF